MLSLLLVTALSPDRADGTALPLFFEGFLDDLGLELFLHLHLLQTSVLVFEFFHARHQRRIHAAVISPPFIKRGIADAMLTQQVDHRRAAIGLLQYRQYLAIAES